jgi:hypothetical protein
MNPIDGKIAGHIKQEEKNSHQSNLQCMKSQFLLFFVNKSKMKTFKWNKDNFYSLPYYNIRTKVFHAVMMDSESSTTFLLCLAPHHIWNAVIYANFAHGFLG